MAGAMSARCRCRTPSHLSINTVAAQLASEVGPARVASLANRLGIGTDIASYPSIALGSDETTLFDMTRAYGAFARGGFRLDPYIISQVADSRGNVIYKRKPYPVSRVLSESVAADMDFMLTRVVESGTGRAARIEDVKVAGKTGTSQSWRDAWFLGYAGDVVGGVWIGNDDDTSMSRVTGGTLPAQIWKTMTVAALARGAPAPADAEPEAAIVEEIDETPPEPVLSAEDQTRLDFYNRLSNAFASVGDPQVAALQGDNAGY